MNHPVINWDSVGLVTSQPQPYPFYLADLPTEEGGLRELSAKVASETAVELAQKISALSQYQALTTVLPSERVALFFEKRIAGVIFPVIRSLCVMELFIQRGHPPDRREVVWINHHNLGPALREVWPSDQISLRLGAPQTLRAGLRLRASEARNRLYGLMARRNGSKPVRASLDIQRVRGSMVAVHYVEGIDLSRRSDLFWFPRSSIDPGRVLVYFDGVSRMHSEPLNVVLQRLAELGMNWVYLGEQSEKKAGQAHGRKIGDRLSPANQWKRQLAGTKPTTPLERWVMDQALFLLQEVEHWLSFYQEFNVKVHVDTDEAGFKALAQSIAFDMTDGIHVGRQRSDSWGVESPGRHPDHVYFAWNRRGVSWAQENRNRIDSAILTGFPHDGTWGSLASTQRVRTELAANGANLVVALFDNAFWWGGSLSETIMRRFYSAFLQWVMEDPQVGVITKSKNPRVLENLPEIQDLMAKAKATGRWINLTNVFLRLPSDASRVADISVGIGISSALTEAVAAGCRGVHCDLSPKRSHPFYQWGYEKVIFDDLERMMAAFKRYKADPASEPELGDFSNKMEQVDPFQDGRAGERAGTYIRWLLEAFDQGKDRDSAMRQANEEYAADWGADKVVSLEVPV